MAELRVFVPVDEFFYFGHGQVLRPNAGLKLLERSVVFESQGQELVQLLPPLHNLNRFSVFAYDSCFL